MSHVYCPECGFQNPESANYCARCGALLTKEDPREQTVTFTPGDGDDTGGLAIDDLALTGTALVVRSGGGRAGETFHPTGERTVIGRSPDCDIFLDDVTVSRRHAELVEREGTFFIEDGGSLNGTFLNRRRIESGKLEDGDEVQIGKYRMTFLQR